MRRTALILLTAVIVPAAASAQAEVQVVPRFSVTAFTGVRAPHATGSVFGFDAQGQRFLTLREERGGSPVLGLEAEIGARGPVRLLIGGVVAQAGQGEFFTFDESWGALPDFAVIYGGASWMAKAGVSYRLMSEPSLVDGRRRASTDFFVAQAVLWEMGQHHPAVNFGAKGAFPVGPGRRAEVVVGLEDYLILWRGRRVETTMSQIFSEIEGTEAVEVHYSSSNRLIFRIGASLRR